MVRTFFWFIYFFLYLVYTLPNLWRANRLQRKGNIKEHDILVKRIPATWARSLVKFAGIKVHVHGAENIPNDTCLVVSNHQGNFDIPILLGYLDMKISFISKIEVKRIPILRKWMEHMNCVFIDRKDRRQSIKSIFQGVKNLQEGQHMVIFPEGTRSKGGPVAPFKKGSFKLATRSNATILPVTIDGSYLAMEANNNIIRPAEVHLTISEPITIHKDQSDFTEEQLVIKVQQQIESHLSTLQI